MANIILHIILQRSGTLAYKGSLRPAVRTTGWTPFLPLSFFFFPIFSSFFPQEKQGKQEKQEKQEMFLKFGNLTEGKMFGRLRIPIFGGENM